MTNLDGRPAALEAAARVVHESRLQLLRKALRLAGATTTVTGRDDSSGNNVARFDAKARNKMPSFIVYIYCDTKRHISYPVSSLAARARARLIKRRRATKNKSSRRKKTKKKSSKPDDRPNKRTRTLKHTPTRAALPRNATQKAPRYLGDPPKQRHELTAVAHAQGERIATGLEGLELLPNLIGSCMGWSPLSMKWFVEA